MSSKAFTAKVFRWLHRINRDDRLYATDLSVGLELTEYFNEGDGGRAWPGCKTIGDPIGLNKTTVLRSVRRLEATSHLRVNWGQQGSGHSNQYWMVDPDQGDLFDKAPAQEKGAPEHLSSEEKGAPTHLSTKGKGASGTRKGASEAKKGAPAQQIHPITILRNHPRGKKESRPPNQVGKKRKKEATEESKQSKESKPSAASKVSASSKPSAKRQTENHQGDRRGAADDGGAASAFERFWVIYPKRVAKEAARRAFAAAIKRGVDAEALVAGAQRYAVERKSQNPKYTKHPATWLNGGCWEDEAPGAPVIDEAGNVVAYEQPQQDDEEDLVTRVVREMREAGVSW
jgi:hypothetical protein